MRTEPVNPPTLSAFPVTVEARAIALGNQVRTTTDSAGWDMATAIESTTVPAKIDTPTGGTTRRSEPSPSARSPKPTTRRAPIRFVRSAPGMAARLRQSTGREASAPASEKLNPSSRRTRGRAGATARMMVR